MKAKKVVSLDVPVFLYRRKTSTPSRSIASRGPSLRTETRFKLHILYGVVTLKRVKRWQYIVLVGLGLLGIFYVYLHRQELGLVGSRDSGAGGNRSSDLFNVSPRTPRITWAVVNRPKDGFRVEMPTDVKEIQVPAYNEAGGTDQVNMIFANPSSDTTFSLAWADNPPVVRANGSAPDRTLDMARDEALARTQTTLVTETRPTPGGFPARDIVARNTGGGMMDTRLIFAGERLYMLSVVSPSAAARREQDVARFFNSFTTSASQRIPETMPVAPAPN